MDTFIKELKREEFNGCNYLELAKKYNVPDRIVRMICGPGYPEGQINLFDEDEDTYS